MAGVTSVLHSWQRAVALAVLAIVAGLAIAGCGGGGPASPKTQASTTSTTTTSADRSSATTTESSTTPALAGTGRPQVTIGDKNFVEQFVLGQLYRQALVAQGFRVNLTQNIGPPDVVRAALKTGSLAMYPEDLNIFDSTIAGMRRTFTTERSAYVAGQAWAKRHALRLLTPTPFSDTNAIAVTDVYASTHHLGSLGSLSHVDGAFVLGGAVPFETAGDGLRALSNVYGVTPRSFASIAVGSQYGDLDDGSVQAAFVSTTDAELVSGDYRLLGDPRHIFGFGNVVPVVSRSVLAKEGPAFAATIERVDRTLTLATMRALNDAANNQSPASVATQYLQTHGLLTPLPAAAASSIAGSSSAG